MLTAEPFIIPIETEPATLRSVRVLDTQSGNRIVTAIEFLSPANKSSRKGRESYNRKRADLIEAGANIVEIDLVRSGGDIVYIDAEVLPIDYRLPYRLCVLRNHFPRRAELYRASFKQRLPIIRIPLREADRDAALDIQALIDQSYVSGQYDQTVDYRKNPHPPLDIEDAAWADALLREQGLR